MEVGVRKDWRGFVVQCPKVRGWTVCFSGCRVECVVGQRGQSMTIWGRCRGRCLWVCVGADGSLVRERRDVSATWCWCRRFACQGAKRRVRDGVGGGCWFVCAWTVRLSGSEETVLLRLSVESEETVVGQGDRQQQYFL